MDVARDTCSALAALLSPPESPLSRVAARSCRLSSRLSSELCVSEIKFTFAPILTTNVYFKKDLAQDNGI